MNKMNQETYERIKQVADEVNKKYEQEAIEDACEEVKENIAKELKGTLPPEKISKVTGLSINTILLL